MKCRCNLHITIKPFHEFLKVPQFAIHWKCFSTLNSTGFDDLWKILEQLQTVNFELPEDLSIRSLRNIFDAF